MNGDIIPKFEIQDPER